MLLDGVVEREIDVVGECSRDTEHRCDARRWGHDRVVVAALESLVNLVERMSDLMRRRAQERSRHVALLLIRRKIVVRISEADNHRG